MGIYSQQPIFFLDLTVCQYILILADLRDVQNTNSKLHYGTAIDSYGGNVEYNYFF